MLWMARAEVAVLLPSEACLMLRCWGTEPSGWAVDGSKKQTHLLGAICPDVSADAGSATMHPDFYIFICQLTNEKDGNSPAHMHKYLIVKLNASRQDCSN